MHRPTWIQTCTPICNCRRGLASLLLELGCPLFHAHLLLLWVLRFAWDIWKPCSRLKDLTSLCPAHTLSVTNIQQLLSIQPCPQPHLLPSEPTKHTKFSFQASQLLFAPTRLMFQTSDVLGRSIALSVPDGHSVHAQTKTTIQRSSRNQG